MEIVHVPFSLPPRDTRPQQGQPSFASMAWDELQSLASEVPPNINTAGAKMEMRVRIELTHG